MEKPQDSDYATEGRSTGLPTPSILWHAVRDLTRRIDRRAALQSPTSRTGWMGRLAAAFAVPILLVVSATGLAGITNATAENPAGGTATYAYDRNTVTITSHGTDLQASPTSGAGTTSHEAVEMDTANATAHTALATDDWFYHVYVAETDADGISEGILEVQLFVDGESRGALYMVQATADPTEEEGATFRWSLGPTLASTAVYLVKVRSV